MPKYDEIKEQRESLGDRAEARRRYIELMDSGKARGAFSIVMMEPEPGDEPGTQRMAMLTDGASLEQAQAMLRRAMGALAEARRNDQRETAPEEVVEAHGRLAEKWLRYAAIMQLDSAPPPVYVLVRKTFYAGIATLYSAMCECEDATEPAMLVEELSTALANLAIEEMIDEEPVSHARH